MNIFSYKCVCVRERDTQKRKTTLWQGKKTSILITCFFSSRCVTKHYLQPYTLWGQLDLHFTHHIQYIIPWINTFLVHECRGWFVYFVTHIHILEKSNVLENKYISNLIPSLSHTILGSKKNCTPLTCNSNLFIYISKLIKREVIACSTANLTNA